MYQQRCRFCTQTLNSVQSIIEHYNDVHRFNKENSPMFKSYIDVISRDPSQAIFKYCKYCQGRIQACFDSIQPLWAPKKTAQIFLQVQINNHIFH